MTGSPLFGTTLGRCRGEGFKEHAMDPQADNDTTAAAVLGLALVVVVALLTAVLIR